MNALSPIHRKDHERARDAVAEVVFDGLPLHHFGVILADPPWRFKSWSEVSDKRKPPYATMTLSAIKSLPVASLAAKDSVLLMWTTDPFLEKAFEVIRAWGFTYSTVGFTWIKPNRTMLDRQIMDESAWFKSQGYWSRGNSEPCLLATRGSPRRLSADVSRLIVAPRRAHSQKPDEQYPRIERLVAGPYVELFARTKRAGWECWGNETDKFPGMAEGER